MSPRSQPASDPLLQVSGVGLRYPGAERAALEGIELFLPAGEVGLLLGAEGAGRSSLLQVVAGLEPVMSRAAMEGEVRVTSAGITRRLPGSALVAWSDDVAIVLDDPAGQRSGARRTVREEVAFGLECRGTAPAEMGRRVDEALATLGLTPLAERDPDTLSGGQTTRLALAAAWVHGPRLLLLDETDAALDAAGRARLGWLLSALSRQGGGALWAPARCESADEVRAEDARAPGGGTRDRRPGWLLSGGTIVARDGMAAMWSRADLGTHGIEAPLRARAISVMAGRDAEAGGPGGPLLGAAATIDPDDLVVDRVAGLETTALSVLYPSGVFSLREVDLGVEPGQILALIGPNGSGKTTLLRALLGLAPVVGGAVRVDRRDVTSLAPALRARHIGLAFQRPTDQLFARTVARDVAFGPRNMGLPAQHRAQAVAAALRVCGLQDLAEAHPLDLGRSGRRRAAIAGVLAMATPIVALDEPDHGLDAAGRRWLMALLAGLRRAGRAVIVVCHDLDLVGAVADRVALLVDGELRAAGPAERILCDDALLHGAGLSPAPAVSLARDHGLDPAPLHGDALLDRLARTRR